MRKWINKMMASLMGLLLTKENLRALLKWASPVILEMIRKRLNAQDQAKLPTEADIDDDIDNNVDVFVAEGKDWLNANPKPPGG